MTSCLFLTSFTTGPGIKVDETKPAFLLLWLCKLYTPKLNCLISIQLARSATTRYSKNDKEELRNLQEETWRAGINDLQTNSIFPFLILTVVRASQNSAKPEFVTTNCQRTANNYQYCSFIGELLSVLFVLVDVYSSEALCRRSNRLAASRSCRSFSR